MRSYWDRVEAHDLGYRLAKGTFWSIAGTGISRGLMLVSTILVARILGQIGYGELGIIHSTIIMFGVFAEFSVGVTATKYVAEFRQDDPDRAGRIISFSNMLATVTGSFMALILYVLAPWLAEHSLVAPHLDSVLRIGSVMLLFSALNGAQTGALAGFEAFRTIARVNLFVGLTTFPILVGGAYIGGLEGAAWALAINMGINWFLNNIALRNEAKRHNIFISFKGCWNERSILWSFSIPTVLSGIMYGLVNWICNTMLVNRPDGYGEMGIYNAANQWYAVMLFLPGMLGSVLLPILSERLGQKETKQSEKLIISTIKINAVLVIPLIVLGGIASPYIISLYGDGFRGEWPTLVVALITGGLLAVQFPVGYALAAAGRMWINFAMNVGWGLIFIIATLFLIDFGSLGLASARAVSYVFHLAWTFGFVYWAINKTGKLDLKK